MDFITWWFDEHYIFSTALSPVLTLAWSLYHGLIIRGIISGILTLVWIFGWMASAFTVHVH